MSDITLKASLYFKPPCEVNTTNILLKTTYEQRPLGERYETFTLLTFMYWCVCLCNLSVFMANSHFKLAAHFWQYVVLDHRQEYNFWLSQGVIS